jgi:hypothetical protein
MQGFAGVADSDAIGDSCRRGSLTFRINGICVCGFSATFQDNDATHDLTATLERRSAMPGSSIDNPPQVMATVKSTGSNEKIRAKSTQAISNSKVDAQRFAYFVRVSCRLETRSIS